MKHKFFSWKNWWHGWLIGVVIGAIYFVYFTFQKVSNMTVKIIIAILGVILIPLLYSFIIKKLYRK